MNYITHITLRSPGDRRSGILKVHGQSPPRAGFWSYFESEVIEMIRRDSYDFYVAGFTPSPAKVMVAGGARPYLKTEPDWSTQNNLLALPEWS